MQHIHSWLSFEEMSADINDEVCRLMETGFDEQAAIAKVAATVAMNRDQLARPSVAVGLVKFIRETTRFS